MMSLMLQNFRGDKAISSGSALVKGTCQEKIQVDLIWTHEVRIVTFLLQRAKGKDNENHHKLDSKREE